MNPLTYSPAIRVINGNSCGTATHIYRDGRYSYWLTNAHVAGTRIGAQVRLERYDTVTTRYQARVVAAAYSRNGTTDIAVLRSDAVRDMAYVQIAKQTRGDERAQHSGGHPRCSQTVWRHRYPQRRTTLTEYSSPNAIGGESGSGIIDSVHNAIVALLTWSANGYCLAQRSDHVYQTLRSRYIRHEPLPRGATVACDEPQDCTPGVYGHTTDLPEAIFVDIYDDDEDDDDDDTTPPDSFEDDDDDCPCDDGYQTSKASDVDWDVDWNNVVRVLEILLALLANLTEAESDELAKQIRRTLRD